MHSKKRWIPVTALVVLLLLSVSVLLRHQIIKYLLQVALETKTEGKIRLHTENLYMDVATWNIIVTRPSFHFNGFYLSADSMMLQQVHFEKLIIKGLSFRRLLLHKEIICTDLIMEKPMVTLKTTDHQTDGKRIRNSFDPFTIMKALKNRSFGQTDLIVDIKRAEMRFGKVDLLQSKLKNSNGVALYTLKIDNLKSTGRNKTSVNELTYQKLSAFVGKLQYNLYKKGYTISLDTAVYHSEKKHMNIRGLKLTQNDKNAQHGIQSFAGDILLQGIILNDTSVTTQKGLHLSLMEISNGSLTMLTETETNRADTLLAPLFFKIFPTLSIDTAGITAFNLRLKNIKRELTVNLNRIILRAYGITLDSSVIDKGQSAVKWKNLTGRVGSIDISGQKTHLSIGATKYNERKEKLTGEKIQYDNKRSGTSLYCPNAIIGHLLLKPLLQQKRQDLDIALEQPELTVTLHDTATPFRSGAPLHEFNSIFNIGKLTVNRGKLRLTSRKGFDATATNLNALLVHPHLKMLVDASPQFQYETLHIDLGRLILHDSVRHLSLKSHKLVLHDRSLQTDSTSLRYSDPRITLSAACGKTRLEQLILNPLLFQQTLYTGLFQMNHPHLVLQMRQNEQAHTEFPNKKQFYYFIKNLQLKDGTADVTIVDKNDTLYLTTQITLDAADVARHEHPLRQWLDAENKKMTLRQVQFKNSRTHLQLKKVKYSDSDSSIAISGARIHAHFKSHYLQSYLPRIILKNLLKRALLQDTLHWQKVLIYGDSLVWSEQSEALPPSSSPDVNAPLFLTDTIQLFYNNLCYSDSSLQMVLDSVRARYIAGQSFNTIAPPLFHRLNFQIGAFHFLRRNRSAYLTSRSIFYKNEDNILSAASISYRGKINRGGTNTFMPYTLQGESIKVYHPQFWMPGTLVSDSVVFKTATLFLNQTDTISNAKASMGTTALNKGLEQLLLNKFVCRNFNLTRITPDTNRPLLQHIRFIVDSVKWAPDASFTKAPYYLHTLRVHFSGNNLTGNDSLYYSAIKSFTFSLPEKRLTFDSIIFLPVYNNEEFFRKAKYQTDRIRFESHRSVISGIDIDTLLYNGILRARKIFIDSPFIEVFRDKRYPLRPGIRKKMPLEWIRTLPVPLYIDTVSTEHAQITYSELTEESSNPGSIRFTGTNVYLHPFSNIFSQLNPTDALKIEVQSKLMGNAAFDLHITVPYQNNPMNNFWMQAKSEKIDLPILNNITQNLMGVTIKSGSGKVRIPFASGNDTLFKGQMIFKYKKLKFRLYNREKATAYKGIAAPFVNFMLNNIMIRANNPGLFGKTQNGIIWVKRDRQKSFMNYIWKGILSGALSTMGFNTKNQRMEKRQSIKSDKEETNHKRRTKAP